MTAIGAPWVVEVQNVTIYQGNEPVLQSVNFEIAPGEFVFLIGKTGGGKSSLFRVLYADLPLVQGTATIASFALHDLKRAEIPLLRRKLGIVFQDFQLLMDRTVEDNLRFVLQATGWKDLGLIKHRVTDVLQRVGLEWARSKMPYQLSGGEQQRIAIARALLNDPVVLLADEPTGNLDPEVAEDILRTFFQISQGGTAVLMATHSHQFLNKYSGRVFQCANGQLIEQVDSRPV